MPETAQKMVQIYVSRLRKVLPPESLQTRPPGYSLVVEQEQLDLHRFEDLVADGRAALDAGQAERAAKRFREALSLWRGPALAEFSSEPFAPAEGARLEGLRIYALEGRIEADLLLGRHGDLVGELELLIARYPLRESIRRQHMLALYRSGRQAEALAAYQDTRRALADELGIEPSTALRELERRILQQDASLDLTTPTSSAESAARDASAPSAAKAEVLLGYGSDRSGRAFQQLVTCGQALRRLDHYYRASLPDELRKLFYAHGQALYERVLTRVHAGVVDFRRRPNAILVDLPGRDEPHPKPLADYVAELIRATRNSAHGLIEQLDTEQRSIIGVHRGGLPAETPLLVGPLLIGFAAGAEDFCTQRWLESYARAQTQPARRSRY